GGKVLGFGWSGRTRGRSRRGGGGFVSRLAAAEQQGQRAECNQWKTLHGRFLGPVGGRCNLRAATTHVPGERRNCRMACMTEIRVDFPACRWNEAFPGGRTRWQEIGGSHSVVPGATSWRGSGSVLLMQPPPGLGTARRTQPPGVKPPSPCAPAAAACSCAAALHKESPPRGSPPGSRQPRH